MNKNNRNYPWYIYQGQQVVLIGCDEFDNVEQYALEHCDEYHYAVPISVALENGWDLNYDTCNPTYLLSYIDQADQSIDNGKEIKLDLMKNVENPEHKMEVWGTIEDWEDD